MDRRIHVVLEEDLAAELGEVLKTLPVTKTRFFNWACREALIILATRRHALPVGASTKLDPKALKPFKAAKEVKRTLPDVAMPVVDYNGWVSLEGLCGALGVEVQAVEDQLDMQDDSKVIDDEVCVSDLGVQTVIALALGQGTDPAEIAEFEAKLGRS